MKSVTFCSFVIFLLIVSITPVFTQEPQGSIMQKMLPPAIIESSISNDYALCLISGWNHYSLIDINNKRLIKTIKYNTESITHSKGIFTKNNDLILAEPAGIYFYDTLTEIKTLLISGNDYQVRTSHIEPAMCKKSNIFSFIAGNDTIYTYNIDERRITAKFALPLYWHSRDDDYINYITYSADEKDILAISSLGFVFIVDTSFKNQASVIDIAPEYPLEYRINANFYLKCLSDSTFISTKTSDSMAVWNYKSRREISKIFFGDFYYGAFFSIDNKYMVVDLSNGFIIYNFETGKSKELPYYLNGGYFNEVYPIITDKDQILLTLRNGCLVSYDFKNDIVAEYYSLNSFNMIFFSSDNSKVYTVAEGCCITEISTGKILKCFNKIQDWDYINGLDMYPDKNLLSCYSHSQESGTTLLIYNLATEEVLFQRKTDLSISELQAKFLCNGSQIAFSFAWDSLIEVYDIASGIMIDSIHTNYPVTLLDISSDSKYIMYHQNDYSGETGNSHLVIRDMENKTDCIQETIENQIPLYSFYGNDGDVLSVRQWREIRKQFLCEDPHDYLYTAPFDILDINLSPTQNYLSMTFFDTSASIKNLYLMDLRDNGIKRRLSLPMSTGLIHNAFSNFDQYFAFTDENELRIHDLAKLTPVEEVNIHALNNISISPNPAESYISITSPDESILSIGIYDESGCMVGLFDKINTAEYIITLDQLTPGIYLFEVITEKQSITKKVAVIK